MKITWAAVLLLLSAVCHRGSCSGIEGFLEAAELTQLVAENESTFQVRFEQLRVFPALTFGCHGSITGWRLAVQRVSNGRGAPLIIIWRRSESNGNYVRVAGERLDRNNVMDLPMSSNRSGIYEGHPTSPFTFQPGDVLGLLFVREQVANFVPYLREGRASDPQSRYIRRAGSPPDDVFGASQGSADRLVPLVALEISSNPTGDCGEAPGTASDDSGLSTAELVIAVAVPLLAVVMALTVVLIIVLFCCTRHRKTGRHRIACGHNGNQPPVALDMKLAIQPGSPAPSPYEIAKPMSPVYEAIRQPWNGKLPSTEPPPPYSENQYDILADPNSKT